MTWPASQLWHGRNTAEPEAILPHRRRSMVAMRRANKSGNAGERATSYDSRRSALRSNWVCCGGRSEIGNVPVVAPLPDVSCHVVQSPRIRGLRSDGVSSDQRIAAVPSDYRRVLVNKVARQTRFRVTGTVVVGRLRPTTDRKSTRLNSSHYS